MKNLLISLVICLGMVLATVLVIAVVALQKEFKQLNRNITVSPAVPYVPAREIARKQSFIPPPPPEAVLLNPPDPAN